MSLKKIAIAILALVGLTYSLKNAIILFQFIYKKFARQGQNLKQYGSWAVVTGATDGIGRAYCTELAKRGLNIILISRTESKLQQVCQELSQKYSVKTDYIQMDMTQLKEQDYERISNVFLKYDIGVLINNAGMSYDFYQEFGDLSVGKVMDIININITALTRIMHLMLPIYQKKGKGCIVNISSGTSSALPTCPFSAQYGASKAYVDSITKATHEEYKGQGIKIQCQSPLYVATKLSKIRKTTFFTPSPQVWAQAAVKCIGYEAFSSPYIGHSIFRGFLSFVPVPLLNAGWSYYAQQLNEKAKAKQVKQQKSK